MFGGSSKRWPFLQRDKSSKNSSHTNGNAAPQTSTSSSSVTLPSDSSSDILTSTGASRSRPQNLAVDTSAIKHSLFNELPDSSVPSEPKKSLLELCREGDETILRREVFLKIDSVLQSINIPADSVGNTILHLAVVMEDFAVVCLLLLKGADPNVRNKGGVSPTMIAKKMGFIKILKILRKHGGIIPAEPQRAVVPMGQVRRRSTKREAQQIGNDESGLFTTDQEVLDGELSTMSSTSKPIEASTSSLDLDIVQKERGSITPQQQFPTDKLPIYDAAYLGLLKPNISLLTEHLASASDPHGCTALMKAAYKGHVSIVESLIQAGAHVNAVDKQGNTALVWAALGGNLSVVRILGEQTGINFNGSEEKIITYRGQEVYPPTPLVAAAYAGHGDIAEYLLDKGADINRKVGISHRRTAIMYAAWMRREEVVRLLVNRGAYIEPNIDLWLRQGIIFLKRHTLDRHAWTGSEGSFRRHLVSSGGTASGPEQLRGRRMSLKDKMSYFSMEENQAVTVLEGLMIPGEVRRSKESLRDSNGKLESLQESGDGDVPVPVPRTRARARNRFRQGMNFDKLIGQHPEVIMELTERVPERGTELDALWILVCQYVIQLLISANQNKKTTYVVISANAIHYASEIARAVEALDKPSPSALVKSPLGFAPLVSTSGMISDPSLTAQSKVRIRIRELTKIINGELPKQLMLTTRIAIGVWPPRHAMGDMIKAAADLAKVCRELVDLANMTGYFALLDKALELNVTPFEAHEENTPTQEQEEIPKHTATRLTYEEYKRQNDLKVLSEISKQSSTTSNSRHRDRTSIASTTSLASDIADPDAQFFSKLEDLVRAFVDSIRELKSAYHNHLKDQYVNLTSRVAHGVEVLIDEVLGNDVLREVPEGLVFDQKDGQAFEAAGIAFGPKVSFPVRVSDIWFATIEEVRTAARNLTLKGKLASGVLPPPKAADEMVKSTVPVLISVKKLVGVAKEGVGKVRRERREDRRKMDEWRRDVEVNERVREMFALWESQILVPQQQQQSQGGEVVGDDGEEEILRDDAEGLVLEVVNGKEIVKGGRLTKLVEWMTSHVSYDSEFTSAFILTHHSFTTSLELLSLLIRRYNLPAPPALTRTQYYTFLRRKIFPVKHRVIAVIKYWLQTHFEEDFAENDLVVFRLRDFVERGVGGESEGLAREVMGIVEEKLSIHASMDHPSADKLNAPSSTTTLIASPSTTSSSSSKPPPHPSPTTTPPPPPPKLPRHLLSSPSTEIYNHLQTTPSSYQDLDPLELSRQLAIIESELFRKIKPSECLDQIWGDRRRKEMESLGVGGKVGEGGRTGLAEMIRHTNVVTMWIANSIIRNDNLKDRREALKYFAQMAAHCHELFNFNGITAINAAMSMAPVNRLRKTWDAFKEKYPKVHEAYEEAASTVSPKGQYANYRKVLKELSPPAVPFLGVSLTDLTFTELGNPDFIPDTSLINFDKRRKVYHILSQSIQKYQSGTKYNLVRVQGVIDFIKDLGMSTEESWKTGRNTPWMELLGEDELYQMSLRVEPREEELSDEEVGGM